MKIVKERCYENWDGKLDARYCSIRKNATLTLTIRIALVQYTDQSGYAYDADDNRFNYNSWRPSEWEKYKKEFADTANFTFEDELWLLNDHKSLAFYHNEEKFYPNIQCAINCEIVDVNANPHKVVEVVNLDTVANPHGVDLTGKHYFRSHSYLVTNLDNQPITTGTDSQNLPIRQNTIAHEFGHLIGLEHVNQGKSLDCPNEDEMSGGGFSWWPVPEYGNLACYGVTDYEKKALMGAGNQVRKKDADPWRRMIIDMLGVGQFFNKTKSWSAYKTEIYPRTTSEVNNNIVVDSTNALQYRSKYI